MKTFISIIILIFTLWSDHVDSSMIRSRKKRGWRIETLPLNFELEEEYSGVFPYTLGPLNVDKDLLSECILSGPGADEEPVGIFSLNTYVPIIEVNQKVDYERHRNFKLKLECMNSVHIQTSVDIQVLDINDNMPVFEKEIYEAKVEESTPQGTDLVTLQVDDQDDSITGNGRVTFTIISVSPAASDLEFFLKQQGQTGQISFRGCLDYEEARRYTITVKAKDNGDVVQLSSTATVIINIMDSNDHKPELSHIMGSGRVNKQETGTVVYSLELDDKDSQSSPAWNLKYTLHGEKKENFKIETDPKTNRGIISITKPLDFEESPQITMLVSVENEDPFFSCKVKQRQNGGLWDVEYLSGSSGSSLLSFPITITEEDVNDPPVLISPVIYVNIMKNLPAGQSLCTFSAVDQDRNSQSVFRFLKGEDVDDWVTLNSATGQVSTNKVLDKESSFIRNGTYTVTVYIINNDEPPNTATGTLVIRLLDENDNLPMLKEDTLHMCLQDDASMTNITAVDLDQPPFSGPFTYELLGGVEGKWRVEPSFGWTVSLVKESGVYLGLHDLQVKITGSHGKFSIQDLRVIVRNCLSTRTGGGRGATVQLSGIAVTIIITSLMLGIVLVTFSVTCFSQKTMKEHLQGSECSLVKYNSEGPGTDIQNPVLGFITVLVPSLPSYRSCDSMMESPVQEENEQAAGKTKK